MQKGGHCKNVTSRSVLFENPVVSATFCLSNRMKGKGINKTTIQEYCDPVTHKITHTYKPIAIAGCQTLSFKDIVHPKMKINIIIIATAFGCIQ